MTPQELEQLLDNKVTEYLDLGKRLDHRITIEKDKCCALGVLYWLENRDRESLGVDNLISWLNKQYDLNPSHSEAFIIGFDNKCSPECYDEFCCLGQKIYQKYLAKQNQ